MNSLKLLPTLPLLVWSLGLFAFSSSALAGECSSNKLKSFAEEAARLDPKIDLDILDLDLFGDSSFAAGYRYKVEPAYTDGLYAREDRWQIKTGVLPSETLNASDTLDYALSAGVKISSEAKFIRFTDDACKAFSLKPYAPNRMPLRARKAIGEDFNIGDYFIFRAQAGIVASAELLSMLSSGAWGLGLNGHYLFEGFYQLRLVRLDETRVRLKVLGHRGSELEGSLNVGWQSTFDVFQVRLLDRGLEKVVNTTPIKLRAQRSDADLFLLDYILDLSDPEVASAFDQVVANAKKFKKIAQANPFKGKKDIGGSLLLDLAPLEDLYQEDRARDQIGRLRRNLRSNSTQDANGWGFDFGNKLFGWEYDKESTTNHIGVRRPDNTIDYYLLRTWDTKTKGRFFYSWSKSDERAGLRALFRTDENKKQSIPVNIVSYAREKDNRIDKDELNDIKIFLKKALPKKTYDELDWSQWDQAKGKHFTNFGFRYDFALSSKAIAAVPYIPAKTIANLFLGHIFEKGFTYQDFFSPRRALGPRRRGRTISAKEQFTKKLNAMSHLLESALDQRVGLEKRIKKLSDLRRNRLFSQCGLSFIISLMPNNFTDVFSLNLNLSSNEAKTEVNIGETSGTKVYQKLLSIKAALDDEDLDLLREAESLSVHE